jgi:hypothetical protein
MGAAGLQSLKLRQLEGEDQSQGLDRVLREVKLNSTEALLGGQGRHDSNSQQNRVWLPVLGHVQQIQVCGE